MKSSTNNVGVGHGFIVIKIKDKDNFRKLAFGSSAYPKGWAKKQYTRVRSLNGFQ